ncbi:unnamed protein product [Arabidopsis thaliana]|uniref:(thale cress) hypothetical protein n=1 Tax=Arabidopsis thaliana TaxID=3702 RepID=A0A7G2FIY0_ARATH|nr:unnamed protein product [Arabidopsis thaliana]
MTMRSLPFSSSSYSLASTSLSNRLETIFKKASELCTLCDIEACVIYYGPDGELKTWPKEKEKVRDIALRYSQLNEALRSKKSVNLHGFLNKKNKGLKNPNNKRKTCLKKNVNVLKYPLADHYPPDQVSQLTQSLKLHVSKFQERLRFLESQKQTKPDHQSLTPSSLNHQTQSLNPRQFSLFMYNHGDNTLSQIPDGYDQNQNMRMGDITNNNFQLPYFSKKEAVQESVNYFGMNQLMLKELYGCDQNMCMGNINSNSFQHPCVSKAQHYSAVEGSVNNQRQSELMQQELCGYEQNMCFTNNNFQVSNKEAVQESVTNFGLMQHELYGCDQNMSMGNIINNSFQQRLKHRTRTCE